MANAPKPQISNKMAEQEIMNKLVAIERNTLLAAKNVLTPDDVVQLTGMSKSYLYKLTSTRQIPHYKPNGKMVYFNREELEKWLQSNRVATDEELEQKAKKLIKKGGRK